MKEIFSKYTEIKISDLIKSNWATNFENLIRDDINRIDKDYFTKFKVNHPNPYRDLLREKIENHLKENEYIFDDL